jgi:hypothetical protein
MLFGMGLCWGLFKEATMSRFDINEWLDMFERQEEAEDCFWNIYY